jgi:hypothetical protein
MVKGENLYTLGMFGCPGSGKSMLASLVKAPTGWNKFLSLNIYDDLMNSDEGKYPEATTLLNDNLGASKERQVAIIEKYAKQHWQLINDFASELMPAIRDNRRDKSVMIIEHTPLDIFIVLKNGIKFMQNSLSLTDEDLSDKTREFIGFAKSSANAYMEWFDAICVVMPVSMQAKRACDIWKVSSSYYENKLADVTFSGKTIEVPNNERIPQVRVKIFEERLGKLLEGAGA